MSLHLHWTQTDRAGDYSKELENYWKHGGKLVEYGRLLSLGIFTKFTPVVAWVPPWSNRFRVGLRYAGWCCLLGWWSWIGLLATPGFILLNLLGGVDVTRLLSQPPPLPGYPEDAAAWWAVEKVRRWRRWVYYAVITLELAVVIALIVWVESRPPRASGSGKVDRAPAHHQRIDPDATNAPRRFYRVVAP